MSKIWEWLKKYWKWIVFPIGIGGAILGWYLWWRGRDSDDQFSTPDDAADDAVDAVIEADRQRQEEIAKLEQEHASKLESMSSEQKKKYEEVRKKTPDEVASWIDSL